jgi:hypothetical protein
METATITQETEQPMYQQGKYPSVVTTDDLVFELGKQLVGGLNKEKLLDVLLEKNKKIESTLVETNKAKSDVEKKVVDLEHSNKQHIENSHKINVEVDKREKVEAMLVETDQTRLDAEKKIINLEISNTQYIKSNQKMSNEINEFKVIENTLVETNKAKAVAEKEVANLKFSNEKYVENNQRLDSELVKIRKELEDARKLQQESAKNYETNIVGLKVEHEKVLVETKINIEKEMKSLNLSNEKYVENNQKLTAEILMAREKLEDMKRAQQKSMEKYELDITEFRAEHEKVLIKMEDPLNMKNEEIQKLKKRRSSKKRGK